VRNNIDEKPTAIWNGLEGFASRALLDFFSKCPGIVKAPIDIGSAIPTRRSATAKLITRKVVRLSLLRFFQNTNMVKMLPTMMIKHSSIAANKTTVTAV